MKRLSTFTLTLLVGSSAFAQSDRWSSYDDYCEYYDPPVCSYEDGYVFHEVRYHHVPPPRYRRAPVEFYYDVWEQPGWVPPVARRPPAREAGSRRPVTPPEEMALPRPRPTAQPKPSAVTKPQPVLTNYAPQVVKKSAVAPVKKEVVEKRIEIQVPAEQEEKKPEVPVDPDPKDAEIAVPVPGAPGFVFSPFDAEKRKVDVRGLPSGSLARDPYTKKVFVVP